MTLVTRSANCSPDTSTLIQTPVQSGLLAGEDIDAAAPCYIKGSDGLLYMTNGTAADAAAAVHGWSPRSAKAGQPLTLVGPGVRFKYADSGLTPGALLYAGATKGRLDTAATVGDAISVAYCLTATDIVVTRADGRYSAEA